ncbi:uncharacterized protein LOC143186481 [Calliopsis andreniformis]|uniref:uncharacterized protein LOC143186481 n=1 Tax=Calliopsis andreniformis TaxID=337506 RepID=UPI003FCE3DBF
MCPILSSQLRPYQMSYWNRVMVLLAGLGARYQYDYKLLPKDVLDAIKPIYAELSKDSLLERCVGGFNSNTNESCGLKTVELAAYISAFGAETFSQMFEAMGVHNGPNAHQYAARKDSLRLETAERRTRESTREAKMHRPDMGPESMILYDPNLSKSGHCAPRFIRGSLAKLIYCRYFCSFFVEKITKTS